MTRRDRLEAVMLEAMKPWRIGTVTRGATLREVNIDQVKLRHALDVAERAGWLIVEPDDGR